MDENNKLFSLEDQKPGKGGLCVWVGNSVRAAGLSRMLIMAAPLAGTVAAVFGWVIATYVASTHETTTRIWAIISDTRKDVSDIKASVAALVHVETTYNDRNNQQDTRLDRHDVQLGDLNGRVAKVEGRLDGSSLRIPP